MVSTRLPCPVRENSNINPTATEAEPARPPVSPSATGTQQREPSQQPNSPSLPPFNPERDRNPAAQPSSEAQRTGSTCRPHSAWPSRRSAEHRSAERPSARANVNRANVNRATVSPSRIRQRPHRPVPRSRLPDQPSPGGRLHRRLGDHHVRGRAAHRRSARPRGEARDPVGALRPRRSCRCTCWRTGSSRTSAWPPARLPAHDRTAQRTCDSTNGGLTTRTARRPAADVDRDLVALRPTDGVEQRQRDAHLQRRRERPAGDLTDRRAVRGRAQPCAHAGFRGRGPRAPTAAGRARPAFSASNASRPQNASFFQPTAQPERACTGDDLQRQVLPVQRVAHLGAQRVACAESGRHAAELADRPSTSASHSATVSSQAGISS